MFSKLQYSLTVFCILIAQFAIAQNGIIRGHLYDKESGEPILYGNVFIVENGKGTTSNEEGFYTFSNLDAGTYTLQASYLGYSNIEVEVTIRKSGIIYQAINLVPSGVELGVVDISAKREQARSEIQISQLQVTAKEIKALPSTGGDADIIQYLQVLPGVVTTGDQGGQIFIRGGSPIQNLILLDGMTIYNPFHSIGFYSVFETEIIRSADVLTGGFNAEYGGRISAVVDIKTREGNKNRLAGQVSASPFMVKGLIEGPLFKTDQEKGNATFVLTGKKSIIDQTSKSLYKYASVDDEIGLPFDFSDVYGKMSFGTSNGSKFNLFGFGFTDSYFNPNIAKIDWTNFGGGMNFTILPQSSSLIVNGKVGYSTYGTSLTEGDERPRTSGIDEYFLGLNFNFFGDNFEFDYGIDLKSIRTDFDFTNQFGINLNQFQSSTELAGYVKYRKSWDKLVIEPSLRYMYYAAVGESSVEPRFGMKFNITDKFRFKAAAGLYSQNLISTSNERDVINLFNGFLSGPTQQINVLNTNEVADSRLQYANHLVAGFEYDLSPAITMNLEGYIKDFTQLIVVNRNKISSDESDYVTETGEAYGMDVTLKYQQKKWYVWSTYSYSFANRFDGEQKYPTVFDRRHNVNFLASYNFDTKGDFSASLRWNFGSGFPFTQTQGFYQNITFEDGVDTDILTTNSDNINIIYSDVRNGGRLPDYHRFDVSVTKKFYFSKYVNLEAVASITNIYDRPNIFYFDRLRYERVDQLPIIPSVGLKLNF